MNTIAIVQARMNSTRLPGKVVLPIAGKPLLWYCIKRLNDSKYIEKIVVATSHEHADDTIVDFCRKEHLLYFRGDLLNVLKRYYDCAKKFAADPLIRITSDCPLVDPRLIDQGLETYYKENFDYVTNKCEPEYLRGFEYEIVRFEAFKKAYREARDDFEKEHVTPFIWRTHPKRFRIKKFFYLKKWAGYRLTVDTAEDFDCISRLITLFQADKKTYRQIMTLLHQHPEIVVLNSMVKQKKFPSCLL